MVLLLAAALAQAPPEPADPLPEPAALEAEAPPPPPEPMRFGTRTFGLSGAPTWTVYRGRHYLTAPQFAEAVGDGPTASLLALEKRRQTRSAVIFLLGGQVAMTGGIYLTAFGTLVVATEPSLGAVMIATGSTAMLGGMAGYYGGLAVLLLRAPRRNRVDLYYSREQAEGWVEAYNGTVQAVEVKPVIGPGYLGVEGRF